MILVIKKKKIVLVSILIVLILTAVILINNVNVFTMVKNEFSKKLPVYSVDTDAKKIAITFDAAWGSDKTEQILDILSKNNAKATFFLVGFWIDENKELVKKISDYGCDIGNHSINHLDMTKLSQKDVEKEVLSVNEKLTAITGKDVKYFRFPYGAYNSDLVSFINSKNMIPVQWSIDSLDWKKIQANEILNRVSNNLKDGSIILFHNNSEHILQALPLVLALIENRGYETVTLSDLIFKENYYIDNNGVQHLNN